MRLPGLGRDLWRTGNARRLLVMAIVDSVGTGLYTTASVVLFSVVVHLTPPQIGRGIAIGAFLGLGTSIVWGRLADRIGVRPILMSIMVWRGLAFAGYAFVHDFAQYLLVATFLGLADRASPPIMLSFATSAVGERDRVSLASALRSIRNAGFTVGALLASLALLDPGRLALIAVMLGNAASFFVAATLASRIKPTEPPRPVRKRKDKAADRVRTRPAFLAAAAIAGLLSVHRFVLSVGIPLWIVTRSLAPKSTVSLVLAVNTVLVVLLQVRVSRSADDVPGAGRALMASGGMLLVCTVGLVVAARDLPGGVWTRVGFIMAAAVCLTFAEMWQAAGMWGMSLRLSPEASRSYFLSVFNLGTSVLDVSGALIITALVLPAGSVGWIGLGVSCALVGAASPAVARWAQREHARQLSQQPVPVAE